MQYPEELFGRNAEADFLKLGSQRFVVSFLKTARWSMVSPEAPLPRGGEGAEQARSGPQRGVHDPI